MTFFTSCEPEVVVPEQDKIYQCYSIDYNASLEKTTVKADFFLNAPSTQTQQRLELTPPAGVKYGTKNLVFNTAERSYQKEFVGLKEEAFIYTNYDGTEFTNLAVLNEPIQINLSTDSTDQQFDYYFEVNGSPLLENETIVLHVISLSSDFELQASYPDLSALTVQISTNQLSALGSGDVVITASRRTTELNLGQVNPVGGEIQVNYSIQDTLTIY